MSFLNWLRKKEITIRAQGGEQIVDKFEQAKEMSKTQAQPVVLIFNNKKYRFENGELVDPVLSGRPPKIFNAHPGQNLGGAVREAEHMSRSGPVVLVFNNRKYHFENGEYIPWIRPQ